MNRSQVVARQLVLRFRAAILLLLVGAILLPAHAQNAARQPVPAADAQAKAEKLIKDLFKDGYAKKKPADLLALSARLLEQAKETKDDATARFVLYREARDLSAQAGDAAQALKITDEMAGEFAVSGPALKSEALAAVAGVVTAPADAKTLAETILQVVEEAIGEDNFETADKLMKVAATAGTKSKNVALISTVQARTKEVEAMQKDFEAVKTALDKLGKNPKDAEANAVAGRYLCLMKGDWDNGVAMLGMSGDAKWKGPAAKDLAAPNEAAAQVEVGDVWWDLGEAEKGRAKANLQKRALYWYRQALPSLSGLTKTKIEKRVAQAATLDPAEKSRTFVFKDIKNLAALGTSKKAGEWSVKNGKLTTSGKETIFWFNDPTPESFVATMVCTSGGTSQALVLGPDAVYEKGEFIAVSMVPGGEMDIMLAWTRRISEAVPLKAGKHTIEARVTAENVVVLVDGKEAIRCKRDRDVPALRRVGLYSSNGNLDIESLAFGPLPMEKK